jgi:aryl carrier-like protein
VKQDMSDALRTRVESLTEHQRERLAESLGVRLVSGRDELVAFVTASGVRPRVEDLAAYARSRLPAYMVPDRYVFLESLPRSASGKLDRRALARLSDMNSAADAPQSAERRDLTLPGTESERILAEIWKTLLDTDEVDIHDDFFELGGDSILSIRLISRANQAGIPITPKQFFESPTIAELAAGGEDP